jgi:hypothetical protein
MQNVSVVLKLNQKHPKQVSLVPHVVPDPRSGQIHLNEGTDKQQKERARCI